MYVKEYMVGKSAAKLCGSVAQTAGDGLGSAYLHVLHILVMQIDDCPDELVLRAVAAIRFGRLACSHIASKLAQHCRLSNMNAL